MTTYILTTEAEADLRGIIRYTRKQWGTAQVRSYIANLEHGIACLAAGRGSFRDMSELFPGLRMARYEHHYVFCLPRRNEPALVVAIFHERMDLMTRLAERISSKS
ncbi:type II toxin-antitoxin system RelE/ParE family toxin [Salmonella enterica]|nr:type II toxin-antitoxin system RelE/ParE family toxin [Salmonella enterica subsp. enterica serovar Bareilly]ECC9721370.1 type II toxin-antitoxin system RelE/ParE family toxin [Salmonella enterica subsp. diarizonae]EJM2521415.1 type II toxin-antitoxin system RelE/ParE family toxin [Salmonella enterica]HCL5312651.1 type II toxin-antitoxin system RelE/ParE family toxin [Salmonella enterica]